MTEARLIDGDRLGETDERHPLIAWLRYGWRKRICKRCGVVFQDSQQICPRCKKRTRRK